MTKKNYQNPTIKVVTFKVEDGFTSLENGAIDELRVESSDTPDRSTERMFTVDWND